MLTLHCYLYGDDPSQIFTVKIEENETVSILKDVIKGKRASKLYGVDASHLVLWKVDLPPTDCQKGLDKINLVDNKPLFALDELSDIFLALDDTHVHVLIKRSSDG